MFLHLYRYAILRFLRNKALCFWTFLFPLFLGTLFYFSFGRAFENTEVFKALPVAVVETEEENESFNAVLEELSKEDGLLAVQKMSEEEAKICLENEEVKGIYFVKKEPELMIKSQGLTVTILNIILEQFLQTEKTIKMVASYDPMAVEKVAESMEKEVEYVKITNEGTGNMNIYLQYFYALLAMSALYGSFLGLSVIEDIQANVSDLGQRRCVASTNKMWSILAEFLSALTMEVMVNAITLFYFIAVLGLDFGAKIPQIALLLLVANAFGISMGIFLGALPLSNHNLKFGLAIVGTMALSFLSGLMFDRIRNIIENACPIINRINPAALIVDSFYVLNIYDTYERYTRNLLTLTAFTVVLCVASFFMTRRNKYASI